MPAHIVFFTESEAPAEQFVREYVREAIDRAPERDGCEGVGVGLNEVPNLDGGSVGMTVLGGADAFLSAEVPLWEEHKESGTLFEWNVEQMSPEQFEETFGADQT